MECSFFESGYELFPFSGLYSTLFHAQKGSLWPDGTECFGNIRITGEE